jgi:hypothetical protein
VVDSAGRWRLWPCYELGDGTTCPDEWQAFPVVVGSCRAATSVDHVDQRFPLLLSTRPNLSSGKWARSERQTDACVVTTRITRCG